VMKCNVDSNNDGNINNALFRQLKGTNIGLQSHNLLLPYRFLNFHGRFSGCAGNRCFDELRVVLV
jgi:hypothetical protein